VTRMRESLVMKWFRVGAVSALTLLLAASCGSDPEGEPGDGDSSSSGGSSGDGDVGDGDMGDGDGGGSDPMGPIELVSHYPAADSTTASALAPITLEFSTDVDESTVDSAVRIRQDGAELAFSTTVTGSTVTVLLDTLPNMPARITVSVTADLAALNGSTFPGDSWSFSYPLWQRTEVSAVDSSVPMGFASLEDGRTFVVRSSGASLSASVLSRDEWVAVETPATDAEPRIVGAVATAEGAAFSWVERVGGTDSLRVASYNGTSTSELGSVVLTSDRLVAELVAGSEGRPTLVVVNETGQMSAHEFVSGAWTARGPSYGIGPTTQISVASSGARLVAGRQEADGSLSIYELGGASWAALGAGITRERSADASELDLAVSESSVFAAYLDGDSVSNHALVAEFTASSWSRAGSALDLEMNNEVRQIGITLSPDGNPTVAWVEQLSGKWGVVAARRAVPEWSVLGEVVFAGLPSETAGFAVASDASGWAQIAAQQGEALSVARFNGSPSLPAGIAGRGERGSCSFPSDTDLSFPTSLAETGCYESLPTRELVSAAIPYNINSLLWSDRAYKKRYILLPEGETMGYSSESEFVVPVGTVVIKEFYLETTLGMPESRTPVETRFLVKRCEEGSPCDTTPWQGYSYQWNRAGSDGVLLTGEAPSEALWAVATEAGATQHTHLYPSRAQCVECHNAGGRLLGISGAQLNRPQDYDGVIDNQIRALTEAGFFGSTGPSQPAETLERIPSPPDVSRTAEERTLSYFQSNCAHCHRPGGTQATIDFRYYGPGLVSGGNICNFVTPTNHETSAIYQRDSVRDWQETVPTQMPPIATQLLDEQQLPVTQAWIENMATCP